MTDFRERPLGKIDLDDGHWISVHHMTHADGGHDRVGVAIGNDTEFTAAVMEPHEAALLAERIMSGALTCKALSEITPEIERLARELDIPLGHEH